MIRLLLAMLTMGLLAGCATVDTRPQPPYDWIAVRLTDHVKETSAVRVSQYRPEARLKAAIEKALLERVPPLALTASTKIDIAIKDFFVGGARYGRSAGQDRLVVDVVITDASGKERLRFEETSLGIRGPDIVYFAFSEVERVDGVFKRMALSIVEQYGYIVGPTP